MCYKRVREIDEGLVTSTISYEDSLIKLVILDNYNFTHLFFVESELAILIAAILEH